MTHIAVALALVVIQSRPATIDVDYGKTMQSVDALRASVRYADAQAELRALIDRMNAGGIASDDALFTRTHDVLQELVALEQLAQQADSDPRAARAYLAKLVSPAKPSGRTAEQAHALVLLAKHDDHARAIVDAAFPARVVVEARVADGAPEMIAWPLENALVEMSLDALPLARESGAGASELRVHVDVFENTRPNSILEGTAMHSYAVQMSALLVGADGTALSKIATTTSILGINPGNAARSGTERVAQALYSAIVDDIAKRCLLG